MIRTIRISLATFLVLLQLVSPLVHAHTSHPVCAAMGSEAGKLHIPGLEALSAVRDKLKTDRDISHVEVAAIDPPSEGLVVGVHSGIKQAQQDIILQDASQFYCLPPLLSVPARLAGFGLNFSPPNTTVSYRLSNPAHSPRAPPSFEFFA